MIKIKEYINTNYNEWIKCQKVFINMRNLIEDVKLFSLYKSIKSTMKIGNYTELKPEWLGVHNLSNRPFPFNQYQIPSL